MMKVLIIDDEANVRDGIKAIIDWEACGFTVCGEGVNGLDGLEKILALQPELTLLDIKMPGLSGIEVAEQARKAGYTGRFIVLSGHSDFVYAQSAIRQGVCAYLLKPIDENDLEDMVRNIRQDIDRECRKAESDRKGLLREALLGRGTLTAPDSHADCRQVQAVLVDCGDAPASPEADIFAFAVQFARENQLDYADVDGMLVLVLCGDICAAHFIRLAHAHSASMKRVQAAVYMGCTVPSYDMLSASYQEALSLLRRRFFLETDTPVLCASDPDCSEQMPATVKKCVKIDEYLDMIYLCIEVGEANRISDLTEDILGFYRDGALKRDKVVGILTNFYREILKRIQDHHGNLEIGMKSYSEIQAKLDEMNTLSNCIAWLRKEFCRLSATIGYNSDEDIIMKLLNYIEKYSDIEMSLDSLAAIFNYNSIYLGRAFKNAVGESFQTYLDKARIKKAEDMLEKTDLKIYEIATKVGYANLDNFFSKFKKYSGISPKDYRKQRNLAQREHT